MTKVVLLGSGNVASFLFEAFASSEKIEVIQVFNHSETSLAKFKGKVPITTSLDALFDADVYLIAVKDDVISTLSQQITPGNGIILHTSGAVAMDIFKAHQRYGVFYPLQTFSGNKVVENRSIPFCLEAGNQKDMEILKEMVSSISGTSYEVSSEQRKKLHLAAVFVCNFVNHLYTVGAGICRENELPFEILHPLIRETAEKAVNFPPGDIQTGPAVRNDQSTIEAHLDQIKSEENRKIYQMLTHAIQVTHGKKL